MNNTVCTYWQCCIHNFRCPLKSPLSADPLINGSRFIFHFLSNKNNESSAFSTDKFQRLNWRIFADNVQTSNAYFWPEKPTDNFQSHFHFIINEPYSLCITSRIATALISLCSLFYSPHNGFFGIFL
jgi:hypothetical protein